MSRRIRLALLSALILALIWSFAGWPIGPASADPSGAPAPQPTPFLTPTPGPDGKIVYQVQKDDTLWRIAAIAGISVEELMALNGIAPNDYITEGMLLVLGTGGPVQPTADVGPLPSPTADLATPTPAFGTGEVCVLLFQDLNGDARLQDDEPPLAGGEVSVVDVGGAVAGEWTTTEDEDGYCFDGLENGDYNVSAAVPTGYNPTTSLNIPLRLEAGDIKYVEFGAQPSAALGGTPGAGGGGRSTILGLVGVLLLLAAGALGYYASRLNRRNPMSLR